MGAALAVFSLFCAGPMHGQKNQLLFSDAPGFYEAPFDLTISSLEGNMVYYTQDGSLPSQNSTLLSGPVRLDYAGSKPNDFSEIPTSPKQSLINYKAWESPDKWVDKIHVIRCASFKDGIRTSPVYTRSYFIDEDISNKYKLPVISLVTDAKNLFDADSGIYVPGIKYDSGDPQWSGNYFQKGREWEHPVHLEYFSKDGDHELSQDAGFRIHGGMTRHAAQKTLRMYARDEYGEDEFEMQLLPQKSVDEYKRFILRTTMGSWRGETIIADILAHELVRDLDVEIMDYQPVLVYLNGEYWGIHTLRDRVDERYIEYTFGIDRDSVDMINGNIELIDAGSNEHYLSVAGYIEINDLSEPATYKYVCTQIDISSFVDYIIAEMFFSNFDWPANNQKLWRPQTPGGKWRWIFLDLDAAYDPGGPNIFEQAMGDGDETDWRKEPASSFLLRHLMKNGEFTSFFIARFAEILNEEFTPLKIVHKLEGIMSLYKDELPRHVSRWNYPASLSTWEKDVADNLLDFLMNRPCEVADQLMKYFELDAFAYSCGTSEEFDEHIVIAPNPNDGNFFIWNNSDRSVLTHLLISDISGRIIFVDKHILLGEMERKYFDFTELSGGMYYLNLISDGRSTVKPMVIY